MTPRQPTWQLSDRQRRHYAALLRASDPDALHDLLVRSGPDILDRDLPYLVIATRNQLRSRLRRGAASHEIPSPDVRVDEEAGSLWDPVARVMANEALRELLIELAELDPRDILVLWSTAAGRSDAEIALEWDELQFQPPGPSPELIRKRRERARMQMRDRLRERGERR